MKKILSLLMFVLLLSSFAYAQALPYDIKGKINYNDDEVLEGIKVTLRTNVGATNAAQFYQYTKETYLNEYGEFTFDLGNSPFNGLYFEGYTLEIKVCNIGESCVQKKALGNECPVHGGCEFYFNLEAGTIVETTDGEKKVEETIITEYVCSDGTKVDDASQCPEDTEDYINYIIGAVVGLGLIGFGALIRYYWNKGQKSRAVKMGKTFLRKRGKL